MSLEWEMACLSIRIVIPKQLRCQVLELAHEGHPGIIAMKQRLRTKVWWPGIDKEVEKEKKRERFNQKNGNGVLVEADGVQYRQNVTHVKKYFERDYDVLPATSKSTDDSEAQRATQSLSNQEPREPVNVSSERASEDGPLEYTRSHDATMEQRNSVTLRPASVKRLPSKF
ncbi:unnamed protein product [Porites evermanni]|uniref:Integrase zinc-binding domain-containing protein n=1 Tax=Porites evermanni TaxID=104178 RepID=A0ABN8RLM7_9CNID|nr:unnamed protein product [Porites evermanni]